MIHNRIKIFFLFFLLFFSITCKTGSTLESTNDKFFENFKGDYYQKSKVLNANNFFEKSSSHYKFLVVRPGDSQTLKIKEIDISFYAYTNKFLEEIRNLFPEKAPPKFTIFEKVKYGEGRRKNDSNELEVEYTNFTIRQSQSIDLLGGLEKFISRKTEAKQLFHEKVSYSITPDEGLWKSEEIHLKDGQDAIRWKNYPIGTPVRNYPYTEFSPNKNTLEYSRIYFFEEYSYKKIFKEIPFGSKFYNNKEFVVFYFPGEKFDPNESNLISFEKNNKQYILYKAELPIVIYKNKESTINESKY